MTTPQKLNLKIYQGSTYSEVVRWESAVKVYKPITSISKAAPLVITSVGHGMPDGWRAQVSGVLGMLEVNTSSDEYLFSTSSTADTITFNDVDASVYKSYTSGGILSYHQPKDLSSYSATMQIRPKLGSAVLLDQLTSADGNIIFNNTDKTITISIPSSKTAGYEFNSAVYSLEVTSGTTVTTLLVGSISLVKEITK